MKLALTLALPLHGALALAQTDPPEMQPKCDRNRDGRTELFVFHNHMDLEHNPQHIDWGMGGGGTASAGPLPILYHGAQTEDWRLVALDDFDGNDTCDMYWQREWDGMVQVTVTLTDRRGDMWAPYVNHPLPIPGPGTGWTVVGSGRFDTDRRADILWWSATERKLRAWLSNSDDSVEPDPEPPPVPWEPAAVVGLTGSGTPGILWRRPGTLDLLYWRMNGLWLMESIPVTGPGVVVGRDWTLAAAADFDDDGHDDLIWQEPIQLEPFRHGGSVAIWYMNATTPTDERLLAPPVLSLVTGDIGLVRGPR